MNIYLHPLQRAQAAADISPEEKRNVINFIAAAGHAETLADQTGDFHSLADFYTGDALAQAQRVCREDRSHGVVAYLKQGHVNAVRYFAGKETIEVDTVETWSATDRYTAQALRNQPLHTVPQTINIQMTPRGWYIDKIAFSPTRN